ncbi:hypothetical protein [Argonema antarcticum]|nr:hypothetical protein [Argonema antarcticum]
MVRSKGEVAIANALFKAGLEYEYEAFMTFDEGSCHPDFIVKHGKRVFIWEHIGSGMAEEPGYLEKLRFKLYHYRCLSSYKYSVIVTTPDDIPERIIKEVIMSPNPPHEYNSQPRVQDEPHEEEEWPLPSIAPSIIPKVTDKTLTPTAIRKRYIEEAGLRNNQHIQLFVVEVGGVRLIRKSHFAEKTLKFDISESGIVEKIKNHRITYLFVSEAYKLGLEGDVNLNKLPEGDIVKKFCLYSTKRNECTNPAVAKYLRDNNKEEEESVFNKIKEILFLYKDVKPQIHILVELTEELSPSGIMAAHIQGGEPKPKTKVNSHKFDIVIPGSPYYINEVNRNIEDVLKQRDAWEWEEARKLKEMAINAPMAIKAAILKAEISRKGNRNKEEAKNNNTIEYRPPNKNEAIKTREKQKKEEARRHARLKELGVRLREQDKNDL